VGGPLASVQDGDMIEVDVAARRIHLDVPEETIRARLAAWVPTVKEPGSGFARLFHLHVGGADTGADFDFLIGSRGHEVPRESH
jgi:dihydroxy-acid dehydratase